MSKFCSRSLLHVCCVLFLAFPLASQAQFLHYINETEGMVVGIEYPKQFLFTSDGRYLLITGPTGLSNSDIDPVSGKPEIIEIVRLHNLGISEHDYELGSIELTKDNHYLYLIINPIFYCCGGTLLSKLLVFERDTLSGRLTLTRQVELDRDMIGFEQMKISPDGKHLYISSYGFRIYDINPATGSVTLKDESIQTLTGTFTISADGKFITVNLSFGMAVYSRNASTGLLTLVEENQTIPNGPITASKDQTMLFIPQPVGIAKVRRDVNTGMLTSLGIQKDPTPDPFYPFGPIGIIGMEITGNDEYLHVLTQHKGRNLIRYAINTGAGTLTQIDIQGLTRYLNGPRYMALSPDELTTYIAGYSFNDLLLALFRQDGSGKLNQVDSLWTGQGLHRGLLLPAATYSADSKFLYLASNLELCISAFDVTSPSGIINQVDKIDLSDKVGYSFGSPVLSPDNNFLYLPAANGDSLLLFGRDGVTGKLTYSSAFPVLQSGYNQVRILPSGTFAYIVGYETNVIRIYSRDPGNGVLTQVGTVNTFNASPLTKIMDVALTADGKTLYVTTVDDQISAYSINGTTGSLTPLQQIQTGYPLQNISISTDGMNVVVIAVEYLWSFQRDPVTGTLTNLEKLHAHYDPIAGTFNIKTSGFNADGRYFFATTYGSTQVYQRDMNHEGRLRYVGMQPKTDYLTYSDAGTSPEEQYFFDTNNQKVIGVRDNAVRVYTLENPFPPAAPYAFTAQNAEGKVVLKWKPNLEPNISTYEVFHSFGVDPSLAVKVGETTDTLFNYSGPDAYSISNYWVKAKSQNGVESEVSEMGSGVALDSPPAIPSGFVLTPGDRFIKLTWNANTESDFKQYHLYRALSNVPAYNSTEIVILTGTTYTDGNVVYGQTYYYWLKAEDVRGNLSDYTSVAWSMPVNLPPQPPANITASSGDRYITVSWAANSEPDLQDYRIYRSTGTDPAVADLIQTTAMLSFQDTNVDYDITYYYWIKARDAATNLSNYSVVVTGSAVNLPPAETQDFLVATGDRFIKLTWSPNSEADLKDYLIYRNTIDDVGSAQLLTTMGSTNFEDLTVVYGTTYFYWISAEDDHDNVGLPAGPVFGHPVNLPPASPINLNAVLHANGSVDLSWSANTEPDFNQYVVYRNTEDDTTSVQQLATPAAASYKDQLPLQGNYFYWVEATDQFGAMSYFDQRAEVTWSILGATNLNEELVSVRPNPVSDVLVVHGIANGNYRYSIMDTSGHSVAEGDAATTGTIPVTTLAPGIYLLRLKGEGQSVVMRFLKI